MSKASTKSKYTSGNGKKYKWPRRSRRQKATLHIHFMSTGVDFKLHTIDDAGLVEGWTFTPSQKGIQLPESLESAKAKAELILDVCSRRGQEFTAKRQNKCSTNWLSIGDEVFVPGGFGATLDKPGYLIKLADMDISSGITSDRFVEYFVEKSKVFQGILSFTKVDDTWALTYEDSLVPAVLSKDAVEFGIVPSHNISALPLDIQDIIPEDLQYWSAEDMNDRVAKRNALVDLEFITDDNVRLVDGRIRRIVQKYYLYDPSNQDGEIAARKRGVDLMTLVSLQATQIQTLILDKDKFRSVAEATRWVREHGFKARHKGKGPDSTSGSFRFRQRDPGDFQRRSFRTISLTDGVKAVVGRPKKPKAEKNEQDTIDTKQNTPSVPEKLRQFNGIIHAKKSSGNDESTFSYMFAIGPVSDVVAKSWREVVELNGDKYVAAGRTECTSVQAEVGDIIKIESFKLLFDVIDGADKRLYCLAAKPLEKVEQATTDVETLVKLLEPHEIKDTDQDLQAAIVKNLVDTEHEVRLIKNESNGEERFVLGIVLEPDVFDAQGDIYDEQTVRKAAHWFMENMPDMGLMHKSIVNESLTILETYVAPVDFDIHGQRVTKGTWLLAARVNDDALWAGIKNGSFTGWSIGGSAMAEILS